MKRTFSILVAAVLLAGLSGCATDRMRVQGGGGASHGNAYRGAQASTSLRPSRYQPAVANGCSIPGPPTGAVSYPYYTIRGPRDFLASDPPSIGP